MSSFFLSNTPVLVLPNCTHFIVCICSILPPMNGMSGTTLLSDSCSQSEINMNEMCNDSL